MDVEMDETLLQKDISILEHLKPIVYGVGNDFGYYGIGKKISQ